MDDATPGTGLDGAHPLHDQAQFVAFYRHAIGPVHRAASRLTGGDRSGAEDLVQQAFTELVHAVRAGRMTSASVGWLIVAVRHRYIDSVRRSDREERRLRLVGADDVVADAGVAWDPQTATELLGRLPDAQRVAVVLHHVDGLPIGEVSALLGRSTEAVESLLARGRARLRALIEEDA